MFFGKNKKKKKSAYEMNKELMAYIEKNNIVDHNSLMEYAQTLGPEYVQVIKAQPYQYQQMLSSNQRANRVIEKEMLNDMMDNPNNYDFDEDVIFEEDTMTEEEPVEEKAEPKPEREPLTVSSALVDTVVSKVAAEMNQETLSDELLASIRAKVEEELKNRQ